LLAVVIFLLIFLLLFVKKAKSQPNYDLPHQIHPLAGLHQGVLYKNEEKTRMAYDIWRAEQLVGRYGGQCIIFARFFTGRDEVAGMAKNLQTNSNTASIGAIVKTRESADGHVAVVLDIQNEAIYVVESNYNLTGRITTRWLELGDKNIIDYLTFD